jgi:hypothetical protein
VGVPPERQAALPDSIRQRTRTCRARGSYTSLIFSLPKQALDDQPAGTWQVEAVAMDLGGFKIWDLYLGPGEDGTWRVVHAVKRFGIYS